MSIIADFTVPSSQFALGRTLQAAPETTVEFEQIVTHSQEWVMPFLWVSGEDLDAFRHEIDRDPTVRTATVSDEFERIVLYRVLWSESVERLINAIFDRSGTLIAAVGTDEEWKIHVRFDDRDELTALQAHFEDGEVEFTLERLYRTTPPKRPKFELTRVQRDTLLAAHDWGYFDVPRRATTTELAEELDVSTNAVSERLRRGVTNLIETTLIDEGAVENDNRESP